jgi:uncharacterized protein with FMN-binding domain
LRPAPYVLVAGLAVAGCGSHKVQRSDKPAVVTTPRASATPAPASRSNGTFVGRDVVTRFGDVQVSVTLKSGRIADVRGVKLPFDRPRSQEISNAASPLLRNEVLNAQSADINLLSGATYTSDAWATSAASALAKAGL